MNKKYWEKFYLEDRVLHTPSRFAKFCLKYIPEDSSILDVGCGNGRDSLFFANKDFTVHGIDFATKLHGFANVNFTSMNFMDFIKENFCNYNAVYARFFLHAISDFERYCFLDWVKGLFMAEFRVKEDKPVEIYGKHKRNLIDSNELVEELISCRFNLLFYQKSKGLEIYKGIEPIVCRVIAEKK